jgi:hypothetical protein
VKTNSPLTASASKKQFLIINRTGLIFLLLTLLTGCVHSKREQALAALGPENAHLLYFQAEPHRSLYVEVDSVEGAEFSASELSRLEAFLRQWSEKPDGVTVAKSSAIPRSAARGHSADSLARRYMGGPTVATNQAPPAYLYILVYDNRVNRNPLLSPRAASQGPVKDTVPSSLAMSENPHVNLFPYRAMIYMDRSWLGGLLPRNYWYETLVHEAGHVLGLVNRDSRAEGHCPEKWCVMNARTSVKIKNDILSWPKREKPKPILCDGCVAELRQSQKSVGPPMRFVGPVLVRKMPLYQVLSLPQFSGLYIVDSIEATVPRFIEEFRHLPDHAGPWHTAYASRQQSRESVLQAIEAAKGDIDPFIRAAARRLEVAVRRDMDQ